MSQMLALDSLNIN